MLECKNTNPIFDQYTPGTDPYKTELARQINRIGEKNLNYWFDSYQERSGQTFITLYVQGKDLCAVQEVLVNDWTGIEGIKRAKGMGYRGAELRGLRISTIQNPGQTTFLYRDLSCVID
jgi:hypothetical protein